MVNDADRHGLARGDGGARRRARRACSRPGTSSPSRVSSERARRRSSAARRARSGSPAPSPARPSRSAIATRRRRPSPTSTSTASTGLDPEEWGDLEPYFDGTVAFVEWPEHGGRLAPGRPRRRYPRPRRRVASPREDHSKTILAFDTATSFGAVCGRAGPARRAPSAPATCCSRSTSWSTTRVRSRGSSSAAGLAASRASASASPWRARSRSRSTCRSPARRRSTPSRVGRPCSTRSAARCSPPGRASASRRSSTWPGRRSSATARCATASSSRRRARRCRPTTTPRTCPIRCSWSSAPGAFGAAGARRAALRPRAGCEAAGVTAVALQIRPLDLADLDAIEAIEQRAYPTPWSRSMFASELAKPTSICLGAFEGERARRLRRQLALRRRLARDERRGRPRSPATRRRHAPCSSGSSS